MYIYKYREDAIRADVLDLLYITEVDRFRESIYEMPTALVVHDGHRVS